MDKLSVLQQPLNSNFNFSSKVNDLLKGINLQDKTVIITGGYKGNGLEITKELVKIGANVIVTTPDLSEAKINLKNIINIQIKQMNLSDLKTIESFCDDFLETNSSLDLLINNEEISFYNYFKDDYGDELHLSHNYLGHFHLTLKLWKALKMNNGARIINLSSYQHRFSIFNFNDPNYHYRDFNDIEAYGQSKTAINLFTVALDEFGKNYGIRSFAVNPFILVDKYHTDLFSRKIVVEEFLTVIWCATNPMLNNLGGLYCENVDVATLDLNDEVDNYNTFSKGVKKYSLDKTNALKLWALSEELTGVSLEVDF